MRPFAVLAFVLCALPHTLSADWFEATGQAVVRGVDREAARAEAVQDAVRKALLYSGASIQSVQQVTDGLLTQETLFLQTQGEVQNVQIISETEERGHIVVTIRADIFANKKQCQNHSLAKNLLISPFTLAFAEQASEGGLHNLGQSSTQVFVQKLQELSSSNLPLVLPQSIRQTTLSYQDRQTLQQKYRSPYLLRAELKDISLGARAETNWTFWSDTKRTRYYRLALEITDLQQEKQVFTQTYQTSALWEFRKLTTVDPHSQRFWETSYGRAIERVLNAAAQDVEENLRCESLSASIIVVEPERVLLNLGEEQGLNIGDELTLAYRKQHKDQFGQTQEQLSISEQTIKITALTHKTAWAEPLKGQFLQNVQVGDVAFPVKKDK